MAQLYPGTKYYVLKMVADGMEDCINFSPVGGCDTQDHTFYFKVKCNCYEKATKDFIGCGRGRGWATYKCSTPGCRGGGYLHVIDESIGQCLTPGNCEQGAPLMYLCCEDIKPIFFSFMGGDWQVTLTTDDSVLSFRMNETDCMDLDPAVDIFSKWFHVRNDALSIYGLRAVLERLASPPLRT